MPKTYKEANFMKDDMCVVNNKMIRKIEEDLWNKLVEYDPEDIEEENIIKEKNEEIIESDDDEGNCIADDEASFISKNIEVEDESNFDKKTEEINDKDDNTINNSMAVEEEFSVSLKSNDIERQDIVENDDENDNYNEIREDKNKKENNNDNDNYDMRSIISNLGNRRRRNYGNLENNYIGKKKERSRSF